MMKGYKKIFWGMFLSIFHVNLGYIRILPPFIAYLVVVIANMAYMFFISYIKARENESIWNKKLILTLKVSYNKICIKYE